MDITNLVSCMGTMFLLMALGALCSWQGLLRQEANRMLAKLIVNVAMSAMIVDSIVNAAIEMDGRKVGELLGAMAAYYGILWVVSLLFGALAARNSPDRGIYQFLLFFGNISCLGFPVVISLFGEGALFYAALFGVPYNILAFSYGAVLITGARRGGGLWRVLCSPPVLAAAVSLALLLCGVSLPGFLADAVGYLGDMTIPGAMLVVGASLAQLRGGARWRDWRLYAFTAVMLLVRPVAVWAAVRLFVQDSVILGVTVMLAAVPVAANATAICLRYGADEEAASCAMLVTTLLSLATLPLTALVLL